LQPSYALFSGLDIPAGAKDYVLKDSFTLPVAMDAVTVGAHAHYVAREMKLTATLPGGEVQLFCGSGTGTLPGRTVITSTIS